MRAFTLSFFANFRNFGDSSRIPLMSPAVGRFLFFLSFFFFFFFFFCSFFFYVKAPFLPASRNLVFFFSMCALLAR